MSFTLYIRYFLLLRNTNIGRIAYGLEESRMVWKNRVWFGRIVYGLEELRIVWYSMLCYVGMVWYVSMVWYVGMVW
jgi:hypothetical protein